MDFNFTIIIPHRNIPVLLNRCLDSIPQRDDIQIVIIDDNSDSSIVNFNDFPGKDRKNVEICYVKETKGAGHARNVGISNAKGKWIIFADADDYFNYCFMDALNEYVSSENDIIYFNSNSVDTETYVNADRMNYINCQHNKLNTDPSKEFFFRYKCGSPVSKFIKTEFIREHNILCEETIIHNDTRFSYLSGWYATKIGFDSRAIYCATYRSSSISYQVSDAVQFSRLATFCTKYQFLKNNGIELFEYELLMPFLHFSQKNDVSKLNECYLIVEQYGISKKRIDEELRSIRVKKRKKLFVDLVMKIVRHLVGYWG